MEAVFRVIIIIEVHFGICDVPSVHEGLMSEVKRWLNFRKGIEKGSEMVIIFGRGHFTGNMTNDRNNCVDWFINNK